MPLHKIRSRVELTEEEIDIILSWAKVRDVEWDLEEDELELFRRLEKIAEIYKEDN